MRIQKASVQQIFAACKPHGLSVVVGGPYASATPMELEDADFLLQGEVETSLPQFLVDLARGTPQRIYAAPPPPPFSRTPVPRFDLLKSNAYASMAIQYSRGCPFHCEFCDIWQRYGNRPRVKAPARVVAELDTLYRLGWRGPVFIVDDNFIGNRRRVKDDLLPALVHWQRRHGYPFRFFTEASINLANYFARCNRLLDILHDTRFMGRAICLDDCRTVWRALWRQSFRPYGFQYLRYRVRNLFRNPRRLAQTIKYGVVGHHFYVITREMLKYEHATSQLDRVYAQLQVMLQAFEHDPELLANGLDPIAAAWRWSATALADVQSRIEKIHVDFRTDLIYHYDTIITRIRERFAPFALELNRQGIDLSPQAN
jgi:hypothetical protein